MRSMNVVLALFVLTLVSPGSSVHRGEVTPPPTARKSGLTPAAHGSLPLRFEQNVGQGVDGARFLSFGASLALFDDRATIALPRSAATGGDGGGDGDADVRVQLMVAGGRRVTPRAEDLLVTRSNYFLGPERSRWFTDIPNFGRIVYASVRDGVDLVFHGEGGQLEYDFVLAPGADPSSLVLEVGGAKDLSLTADGHLAIRTERGVLVQREPRVFQRTSAGALEDVPAGYRLLGARTFAFEVASYDATRELVIDPVLEYSTFLGGRSSDGAMSVAVDAAGSAYLAGTASPGFPLQATIGGPSGLAFVAKLTPSGNNLVYATAVAGTGDAIALAIDSSGCAYVGGSTISDDLPLVNAVQTARAGVGDAYLFKVSADGGSLLYSTYFGGGLREEIEHIAVDAAGSAFVVGSTASSDLPTRNALRPAGGQLEAFVAKFGPGGSVDYATYLGGTRDDLGHGIAIDSLGSAYIVGSTSSPDFPTVDAVQPTYVLPAGFVTKLAPSGAAIEFSTFIGSNGSELRSVVVDAAGSAFVTGTANPAPLPVTRRFLADVGVGMVALKLSPNGRAVDYLATFGTSTFGRDIAVDSRGSAIVVGTTTRPIPTQSPVQPTYGGGGNDGVLFKLSPDGQALELSTYLGGSSIEFVTGVAVDSLGGAYLVGTTNSSDFPVVNAIQPGKAATSDAFVAKIFPPPYLSPPDGNRPAARQSRARRDLGQRGGVHVRVPDERLRRHVGRNGSLCGGRHPVRPGRGDGDRFEGEFGRSAHHRRAWSHAHAHVTDGRPRGSVPVYGDRREWSRLRVRGHLERIGRDHRRNDRRVSRGCNDRVGRRRGGRRFARKHGLYERQGGAPRAGGCRARRRRRRSSRRCAGDHARFRSSHRRGAARCHPPHGRYAAPKRRGGFGRGCFNARRLPPGGRMHLPLVSLGRRRRRNGGAARRSRRHRAAAPSATERAHRIPLSGLVRLRARGGSCSGYDEGTDRHRRRPNTGTTCSSISSRNRARPFFAPRARKTSRFVRHAALRSASSPVRRRSTRFASVVASFGCEVSR